MMTTRTARGQAGLRRLTVALGAGIVLCALVSAGLWLFRWQRQAEPAAGPETVQTVRPTQWPDPEANRAMAGTGACVRRMSSIDSSSFDQDIQGVLDCSTGDFRSDVATNKQALEQALGTSTSITAKLNDSALVRLANGRGTFLFSVDSTVTKDGGKPQVRKYRIVADTMLVKGSYLMSSFRIAD